MTKKLVTVKEGVSREDAQRLLHQHRIEKLLVVDEDFRCIGLVTVKDIEKAQKYPNACKDEQGRLRVAAATSVGDDGFQRAERADRRRRRPGRGRHRARPLRAACWRSVTPHQEAVEPRAGDRRQRRHRRRHQGADRRRAPTRSRSASARARSAPRASSPASACRSSPPSWMRSRWRGSRTCRSSPTAASSSPATWSRRWPPAPTAS